MSTYATNMFKGGLKLMIDGEPCSIIEADNVKPGKGQAFCRVKLRQLKTGKVLERTYKSGETVEGADVMESDMDFLYSDAEFWHFMEPKTFEQHAVSKAVMGDASQWLSEGDTCSVTTHNEIPILIEAPNFVVLEITDTDPGLKGDTVSGGGKPATLSTGAVVRVPLFVAQGEKIKVDTRIGEYVSRAKEKN